MELVVNQNLEFVSEPVEVSHFTNQGILTSNYKSVVKNNFSKSTKTSIFGIRQRIKSSQFHLVDHTAVILKLSIFAVILTALF